MRNLQTAQTLFMAPILLAFVIGALPILLAMTIYRKLTARSQKPAVAVEPQAPAPAGEIRPTIAKAGTPPRNPRASHAASRLAA